MTSILKSLLEFLWLALRPNRKSTDVLGIADIGWTIPAPSAIGLLLWIGIVADRCWQWREGGNCMDITIFWAVVAPLSGTVGLMLWAGASLLLMARPRLRFGDYKHEIDQSRNGGLEFSVRMHNTGRDDAKTCRVVLEGLFDHNGSPFAAPERSLLWQSGEDEVTIRPDGKSGGGELLQILRTYRGRANVNGTFPRVYEIPYAKLKPWVMPTGTPVLVFLLRAEQSGATPIYGLFRLPIAKVSAVLNNNHEQFKPIIETLYVGEKAPNVSDVLQSTAIQQT